MTRWSEQEYEHFFKGRMTAAQQAVKKAQDKAKHESNKATEQAAKDLLTHWLKLLGVETPQWEFRFDLKRRWRFDGALPVHKIAIEIEGGLHSQGRHTRGAGYANDLEKYNAAALAGWRVFRFTYPMIRNGSAADTIKQAIGLEII